MNSKGRLLYIINHVDWFWSHRLPLAYAAQQDGWEVFVAAHGATADKRFAAHGFQTIELPTGPFPLFFALRRLQKSFKPALTHAITIQYAFLNGLACRTVSCGRVIHTIAGLGYLFSADGMKPKLLRFLVMPFLKIALNGPGAQIIFQNSDDMGLLIKNHIVPFAHCHLIPGSGVDVEEFFAHEEPVDDVPMIIMPTRLVADKGVRIFVEAARILKRRGVGARFCIAGGVIEGNPRALSAHDMQDLTNDGAVEWLGRVHDMPGLLRRSLLVVYPSWYREGVPKVLLEAAASARAIVTTDHPGCREAVAHDVNGLLVPIKDSVATANAIETLLQNPERRKAMGLKGRARAMDEFNVTRIVAKTIALY